MAYYFYLGKTLLPVAPQKLQLKIKGANKTYTLINDGEINVLKTPGLTDIEFDALLPNVKYPFAVYKNGFTRAKSFLEVLKNYKQDKETFQFIVTRTLPNGKMLFDTNMKVSLESYTIKEDAKVDALLSLYNKKTRKLTIKNALGDTRVRAGSMVVVIMDLGDVKLKNLMLVEKCVHTFKLDEHTMELKLRGGEFVA